MRHWLPLAKASRLRRSYAIIHVTTSGCCFTGRVVCCDCHLGTELSLNDQSDLLPQRYPNDGSVLPRQVGRNSHPVSQEPLRFLGEPCAMFEIIQRVIGVATLVFLMDERLVHLFRFGIAWFYIDPEAVFRHIERWRSF
jgi:hypothetical protein